MEKQASDLKQRDDDIARLKEENKRLNARLSQKSTPPEAAKSTISTKPTSTPEMAALQRVNKDHIEKLNNQKAQINSLLAQNGDREDDHSRNGGSRDHRERYESTCKESWGKHSPRLEPNRRDSGASSILATPAIEHDYRAASDTSERNGDYSSFASYGKRNSTPYDSRSSHWERSVRSPPTPKEAPYVPTGPRAPQVRLQPTYMS
jgi:hypothetical protein